MTKPEENISDKTRKRLDRNAALLAAAMRHFQVDAAGLAAIVGLGGPAARGDAVDAIIAGSAPLSKSTRRAIAYAMKFGPMSQGEEDGLLAHLLSS